MLRRQAELLRRVGEGTIPVEEAMQGMQALIERRKVPIWWKDEEGNFRLRIRTGLFTVEEWIEWNTEEKCGLPDYWKKIITGPRFLYAGSAKTTFDILIRPNHSFLDGETLDPDTWKKKPESVTAIYKIPSHEITMTLFRSLDNSDLLSMGFVGLLMTMSYPGWGCEEFPLVHPRRAHVNRLLISQGIPEACVHHNIPGSINNKLGVVYSVV